MKEKKQLRIFTIAEWEKGGTVSSKTSPEGWGIYESKPAGVLPL